MSDFASWSIDDVAERLDELGLSQYSRSFRANKISGRVLPLLKDCHLKELGMAKVGHRLRFAKFIAELGSDTSSRQRTSQASRTPMSSSRDTYEVPAPKQRQTAASRAQDNDYYEAPKQRQPSARSRTEESYDAPAPKRQPVRSSDTEDAAPPARETSTASKDWEKKRRQMLMKRMQAEKKQEEPASYREEPAPVPKPRTATRQKPAPRPAPVYEPDEEEEYVPPPPPKRMQKARVSAARAPPPPPEDDPNDDRRPCAYCGRRFASDRIDKHEEVCARMSAKKTKVFDARKQRLQGTEAAQFARNASKDPTPVKKSNYKAEHEKLVEAMRAARKLQAYEKAREEGRAVGPPPDLPKYEIENDDRVDCPHCGRKFAEEAAKRHIPVCERMNAGKSRGGARGRGRR